MTRTNDLFPIDNDAACVLKWGWNTVRLFTGRSSSCHRVKPVYVSPDDFDRFHNTPEVLEDRRLMLDGQWPEGRGCEYCKNVEDSGGLSDRMYHNAIAGLTPVDFENGNLEVTPRILEVYLDNACDLACIYCSPWFSSKINSELSKFGPNVLGTTSIKKSEHHAQYLELLMQWLEENYLSLKRLSILGGEPLLQKEFWRLLDWMETKSHSGLELSIVTNLNAPLATVARLVDTAKKLIAKKKISRLDINCSLDCWGPQQQFIRYGIDLNRWEENFRYLISHKWLVLAVHPVITNLSINSVKWMQDKVNGFKDINPNIRIDYHVVDGPAEILYHPSIFDRSFYGNKMQELVDGFIGDDMSKQRLVGIAKLVDNAKHDATRLKRLKIQLDQFNIRRSLCWEEVFPEVDAYFRENHVV